MVNSYPIWKYILIVLILIIGIVYAVPNFYKKYPAIYITQCVNTDQCLDDSFLRNVKKILYDAGISYKSIMFQYNKINIWFFCQNDQIYAYEQLLTIMSNKYLMSFVTTPIIPNWLSVIHARPVQLGLDLCGGIHLLVSVDVDSILNIARNKHIDIVKCIFHDKAIPYTEIEKIENYGIGINCLESKYRKQAMFHLHKEMTDIILQSIDDANLRIFFSENYLFEICRYVVKQNSIILNHRLHQLGIFDPFIQCYGMDRIIIDIPGIQDIEKIKQAVGTTASLEFRLVNTTINTFEINNNIIPEDSELKLSDTGYVVPLYKKVILTGEHIIYSNVYFDEYNRPQVNLGLDKTGSIIMSNFTKNNIGKTIATVFIEYKDSGKKDSKGRIIFMKNERVINMATIQSQVSNNFRIIGINNVDQARQLSIFLRTGALVAPVHIEEEKVIGPILGKKNIRQGITACILGIIISILFMIIRYHCFGLIAGIALISNLIFMISIISLLPNVVLTMPSIAGIILTLSVAIDANVLINERIKEEIKHNKPMQYAIYVGYRKAFVSIIDANITTIIIAVILYLMGTGIIKGFAIITVVGVGTSMCTSIVGTRAIVNLIYGGKRVNKLSI